MSVLAIALMGSANLVEMSAQSNLRLWYNSPSGKTPSSSSADHSDNAWMEYALPIGNGQLGATFMGNVDKEYLQFNEKTLWSGTSNDYEVKGSEASGTQVDYGAYQNFGILTITTNHSSESNYTRELDLTTATGKVSYTASSVGYTREFIASYPDQVVAARFSANATGKLNLTFALTAGDGLVSPTMTYADGGITLSGDKLKYTNSSNKSSSTIAYASHIQIVNVGGSISASSSGITVSGANEVLVLLAAGTTYDPTAASYSTGTVNDVINTVKARTTAAQAKGWDALYTAHVADYQEYFNRVEFSLNGANNNTNTQSLVSGYGGSTSANDLMLEQLYFAYGRYLSIASSRGVALPSNLQGIWANRSASNKNWNSDIHANINVQMNYWPTEATNLSEMHQPFLDYIINMSTGAQWTKYAKDSGQSCGWTTFTENNIFGGVGWWTHNYVVENAWLSTHLWQHYEYTLDDLFLEKAFPTMWSATEYWLERVVQASDGTYECPNEYSPEHGPSSENAVAHAQQLVWELFDNTLKAVDVLGSRANISTSDLNDLKTKFAKLDKGLATETYKKVTSGFLGLSKWDNEDNLSYNSPILREWKYSEFSEGTAKHRHLSHLMCLYPFNQVSGYNTDKTLYNAAINSLKLRGDAATGWAMGWKINLWARAFDGNHAHTILEKALTHSTTYKSPDESKGGVYYNLWSSHAPFQIDGNFGATAGITEMLFQSHSGVLNILPALPDEWKNGGSITGLKGRGNFTVGITWEANGNPTRITITNNKGQEPKVTCSRRAISGVHVNDVHVLPTEKDGVYTIPSTTAGDEIVIDFTGDPAPKQEPSFSISAAASALTVGQTTQLTVDKNSDGDVTYVSSNTDVATVDNNTGLVTAVAPGTATITANLSETDDYTAATATCTITVKAAAVAPTVSFTASTTVIEGQTTQLTLTTNSDGAVTYVSSNTAVATVDSKGKVTAVAPGKTTITVNIAATETYKAASASCEVTVEAAPIVPVAPEFALSAETATLVEGESTELVVSTNSDGKVTYVSSNTAVATVDNNGVVTAVAAGTATITASVAATTYYTAATATYDFTVEAAIVEMERTITITAANKYSTCILPFNASIPSGVEAYECASVTGDYLDLTRVYSFVANTPYILYAPDGVDVTLKGEVVDETVDGVTKGLLTGFALNAHSVTMGDGNYVLQNQGQGVMFYNASGMTLTIPAGRCYLTVPGNKARALRIRRETTDIEGVIEEGESIIYDLMGRRVTEMQPGRVYIVNGKKIVY